MENKEKYLKYLKWKEQYEIVEGSVTQPIDESGFCLLCSKLNDQSEPVKIYENITKWHGTCRTPIDHKFDNQLPLTHGI